MRQLLMSIFVIAAASCFPTPASAEECLDCHELASVSPGGTVVHPPFGDKDCGSCHADHGDQERLVLTETGNALCAQCHEFAEPAFLAAHRKIPDAEKFPERNRRAIVPILS